MSARLICYQLSMGQVAGSTRCVTVRRGRMAKCARDLLRRFARVEVWAVYGSREGDSEAVVQHRWTFRGVTPSSL